MAPPAPFIYADQMERYKGQRRTMARTTPYDSPEQSHCPNLRPRVLALPPEQRCRNSASSISRSSAGSAAPSLPPSATHITDGMTPAQTEALAAFEGPARIVEAEDIQVKLLRDIYTRASATTRSWFDFWLNHFNVYEEIAGSSQPHSSL